MLSKDKKENHIPLAISKLGVSLLLLSAIYILKQSGFFRSIHPHFTGSESIENTAPGVEDITTNLETGIAYLSSHDRRNKQNEGLILYKDLVHNSVPKPMYMPKLSIPFRPHGISLLNSTLDYLFVVNHSGESTSEVIRFEIQKDSLLKPIIFKHSLFKYLNDVEVIDSSSFYVSNDHTTPIGWLRTLKDFTLQKDGNVVFFKDGEAATISQNFAYANGLKLTQDKTALLVAATTENRLYVLEHNDNFNSRKVLTSRHLGTSPDNIEIDKFGFFWITCHPQLLKFLAHGKDPIKKSPTQILKVVYLPETDYKFLQEEVYLNNGNSLSGGSVASYFHTDTSNYLMVGSVFEPKILRLSRDL